LTDRPDDGMRGAFLLVVADDPIFHLMAGCACLMIGCRRRAVMSQMIWFDHKDLPMSVSS
jgi:hypothetical protein